jgi:hypothetical protein
METTRGGRGQGAVGGIMGLRTKQEIRETIRTGGYRDLPDKSLNLGILIGVVGASAFWIFLGVLVWIF